MKLLITGSSGFIGKELVSFLKINGHDPFKLVRTPAKNREEIFWDIENQTVDSSLLEGFDAIIHLAGENIGSGRWNEQKKQKIFNSRIQSTRLLAKLIPRLKLPPKVFISTSAIGFYGDRGEEYCFENTPNGTGFLADVCKKWEEETLPISESGIRTVIMRNGIVLSPKGGVLKKTLLPFKLGLGGKLGSGKQFMSWIALDDLLAIVLFILQNEQLEGALNTVSPNPVTNLEFTKTVGAILHRPTCFSVPAFLLRFLLGAEMADELLLNSVRVKADKLIKNGYTFLYPDINNKLVGVQQ
jgi:uncharacterized protein